MNALNVFVWRIWQRVTLAVLFALRGLNGGLVAGRTFFRRRAGYAKGAIARRAYWGISEAFRHAGVAAVGVAVWLARVNTSLSARARKAA
jgi:hypothetical protein